MTKLFERFGTVQADSFIDGTGAPIGGGGGTTFEYAGSMDGADIWTPAATAIGIDDSLQNDALRVWISVIDAGGEAWYVQRANEEGWGVSFTRIAGTNSVPQAGTYTVLALWVTNV